MSFYDIADEILLGIDEDRISWAGKKYEFDNDFFMDRIKTIDKDRKIKIVEDNFHKYHPLKNDTEERNTLSKHAKKENYLIGIDSDEILLNPDEFGNWLKNQNNVKSDMICTWHSVFKFFGDKMLVTIPNEQTIIGTNLKGYFKKCRMTSNNSRLFLPILSPLKMLHFSWGRSRKEIKQKLENWSHTDDFNHDHYMRIWDDANLKNYKNYHDFHPLGIKTAWNSLELIDLSTFELDNAIMNEISGFGSELGLLTIIVVIKDEYKLSKTCLESIQRYYKNEDIIVIDDGTQENQTIRCMKSICITNDWKYIRCDSGTEDACRIGISVSQSENMFFFNSSVVAKDKKYLKKYAEKNRNSIVSVGKNKRAETISQILGIPIME